MWVRDYMKDCFNTITSEKTLEEAVKQMVDQKVNSLIVVDDEKKPIGLVSSHALIREVVPEYLKDDPSNSQFGAEGTLDKYAGKAKGKKVESFMYKDFHVLNQNDPMIEAAAYLIEGERRTLPVADDDGKLVGVVTRTCVKRAIYNSIFKDNPVKSREDCGSEKHTG